MRTEYEEGGNENPTIILILLWKTRRRSRRRERVADLIGRECVLQVFFGGFPNAFFEWELDDLFRLFICSGVRVEWCCLF